MTDTRDEIRKLQMLRALSLIADGRTKKAACAELGFSTATFDRYLAAHPAEAGELVRQQRASLQSLYTNIVAARREVIQALVLEAQIAADPTNPETDIRKLLRLEKRLGELQAESEQQLGVLGPDRTAMVTSDHAAVGPSAAESFLKGLTGPVLRPGKARLAQTIEVEFGEGEEPSQTDVIDGETTDAEEA